MTEDERRNLAHAVAVCLSAAVLCPDPLGRALAVAVRLAARREEEAILRRREAPSNPLRTPF